MSRLLVAQRALTVPGWAKDALWRRAQAIPSLDLRFADNKSLVDATTGQNLVTFTRASSGTYVGSDGLIKTAVTNLVLRSEEFDNASWAKANVTVQENAALAPNGSTLADKLIASATTTVHNINQIVTASSAAYTFSIYLKAAELTTASIRAGRAGNFVNADINLSLGTIAPASQIGTATNGSSSIQRVSNDWYRCSVTGSNLGDGQINAVIYIPDDATQPGDGTSGIYLWGAQLEQSTTVGEYVPTTSTINSAPRFDHNPTTGESLGLLVEEARTNLVLQSEDFSTTWTNIESSENINVAVAPNGTTTADALVDTVNNSPHNISQNVAGLAGSTSYTFSCYMKKGSKDFGALILSPNASWGAGSGASVYFDLTNGTISASTSATGTIQALPNGWYRCTATATTVASPGTVILRVSSSLNGSASTYAGDGDEAIYLWGAQLEVGSFPTSYIPTTTAAVTRSADLASITGSAFSGWYRQDEGDALCRCNGAFHCKK